jgi:hypothetical protein
MWSPVYRGGGTIRFAHDTTGLRSATGQRLKVLYLLAGHALVSGREVLADGGGRGVRQWRADRSRARPRLQRHGWAALVPPPGWTTADTVRLRALLNAQPR